MNKVLLMLLAGPSIAYPQARGNGMCETDNVRLEQENYPIGEIIAVPTYSAHGRLLSEIQRSFGGTRFTPETRELLSKTVEASLTAEEADMRKRIDFRFAFRLFRTCVIKDPGQPRVNVALEIDHLVLDGTDSASRIVDEASRYRLRAHDEGDLLSMRSDYDRALGLTTGFGYDFGERVATEPRESRKKWVRGRLHAWRSTQEPYGFVSLSMLAENRNDNDIGWVGSRRGIRMGYNFSRLPYGQHDLKGHTVRLGWGTEIDLGDKNLSVQAKYRWSRLRWMPERGPGVSFNEHALEATYTGDLLTTAAGLFLRYRGWADVGYSSKIFVRAGAEFRMYKDLRLGEFSTFTYEGTVGFGSVSAGAPVYRSPFGGNTFNPVTLETSPDFDDFAHVGPKLRGIPLGGFFLPTGSGRTSTDAARFLSLSLTFGLPGYLRPLIRAASQTDSGRLFQSIQQQYIEQFDQLVLKRIQSGDDADVATAKSLRDSEDWRHAIRNLMRHSWRLSVRPIAAADIGLITSGGTHVAVASLGGGVRVQALKRGVEILYLRNTPIVSGTLNTPSHNIALRLYAGVPGMFGVSR